MTYKDAYNLYKTAGYERQFKPTPGRIGMPPIQYYQDDAFAERYDKDMQELNEATSYADQLDSMSDEEVAQLLQQRERNKRKAAFDRRRRGEQPMMNATPPNWNAQRERESAREWADYLQTKTPGAQRGPVAANQRYYGYSGRQYGQPLAAAKPMSRDDKIQELLDRRNRVFDETRPKKFWSFQNLVFNNDRRKALKQFDEDARKEMGGFWDRNAYQRRAQRQNLQHWNDWY